jgi:putative copper resistance protein D
MGEALYACRFVHFTAAMLLFGIAAFRVYALPGNTDPAAAKILARFDAYFGQVLLIASFVALISAVALLICQTAEMTGSFGAAMDFVALDAVLFDTLFGRVWCWHLLLAGMLVLACYYRQPRRRVVLILALGLLASLGWVGHAAMDEGAAWIGHELNQTGHLLAAGLWLGGLAPLAWLLRQTGRLPDEISLLSLALRNFSHMGYAAVVLIALTGTVNTLLLVGSVSALLDTDYGRLLAVKILLFVTMVAVGSINRFHLAPRISNEPGALRTLGRTVAFEQSLGLAVLAVVSILGTWPPGFTRAAVERSSGPPCGTIVRISGSFHDHVKIAT